MHHEPALWSPRLLRAAYWVVRVLGADGEDRVRSRHSWNTLPIGGRIGTDELRASELALVTAGLVAHDPATDRLTPSPRALAACAGDERSATELLLSVALETIAPLWLRTATGDGTRRLAPELIPEGVAASLGAVIPDPARREAVLLAAANKVELAAREQLGEAGEIAVVDACRAELHAIGCADRAHDVRRVSLVSDELGYDVVAPRADGSVRRLEVKATRSAPTVFVSRNEMGVGRHDPDWWLVVVRVPHDGRAVIVGHAAAAALEPLLPEDRSHHGRWQAARLHLPDGLLAPGLPAVGLRRGDG